IRLSVLSSASFQNDRLDSVSRVMRSSYTTGAEGCAVLPILGYPLRLMVWADGFSRKWIDVDPGGDGLTVEMEKDAREHYVPVTGSVLSRGEVVRFFRIRQKGVDYLDVKEDHRGNFRFETHPGV